MRTQKYCQVEAIVTKYETLAANTKAAKEAEQKMDRFLFTDCQCLLFMDQLIIHIYQLCAGEMANPDVLKKYAAVGRYYQSGLLSESEEQFLVDNFDLFVDYAFENRQTRVIYRSDFNAPIEWSGLVSYLLKNDIKKVFIPTSDCGREFMGLNDCEVTVADGFCDAAIRALTCRHNIHAYKFHYDDKHIWSDIEDGQFDAVILEITTDNLEHKTIDDYFTAAYRLVHQGGELLFCISKDVLLTAQTQAMRERIVREKTLQDVIQLPSGNILFHVAKKEHDSFVMCDARELSLKGYKVRIDIDALIKEIRMSNLPEREDNPLCRRFPYEKLKDNILLPSYYLSFPVTGTPFFQIAELVDNELVLSDACDAEEKIVTLNHLSTILSKAAIGTETLSCPNRERLRQYQRVEGPVVVMAVSAQNIAIGYITDNVKFLVPCNLYVLKPKVGIDVVYLACLLFNQQIQNQLTSLVSGRGVLARLVSGWENLVLAQICQEKDRQSYIQNVILKDYATQESYIVKQEIGYKHAIRLRKHALSQNISAFDSLFHVLENCMKEHRGNLKSTDLLSPVSTMTVADAMDGLRANLTTICERVAHLSDDQDWGNCEAIEPQQFIEEYEQHGAAAGFRFEHTWEYFETNSFDEDVFDSETGKLLFKEGEPVNSAWFPRRALKQVFDNIVSNACEHGFTDKKRHDYVIKMDWTTDGLNMIIRISNNGKAMPVDIDTGLVLEYGYSSVLNQRGHGGIGGGEIAEIMRKYGGNVKVISTPERWFAVTYVLTMPLASLY